MPSTQFHEYPLIGILLASCGHTEMTKLILFANYLHRTQLILKIRSCVDSNEPSVCIKKKEFLEYLKGYKGLRKDYAPLCYFALHKHMSPNYCTRRKASIKAVLFNSKEVVCLQRGVERKDNVRWKEDCQHNTVLLYKAHQMQVQRRRTDKDWARTGA